MFFMNTWSVKENPKALKNKILLYSSGLSMSHIEKNNFIEVSSDEEYDDCFFLKKKLKSVKEELKMEKDENDLYMELLDVSNPEEAKDRFDLMKKLMKNLEERNHILEERVLWNEKNYLKRIRKLEGFDGDN